MTDSQESPTSNNLQPSAEGKTAKIIVTPCDDGQFGLSNCGNCGALLKEESPTKCPECGISLSGIESGPNFGGSDF